jgi:hypothetical protein
MVAALLTVSVAPEEVTPAGEHVLVMINLVNIIIHS